MRLFVLTCLTMCAFAGNSILNRWGVAGAGMEPMAFALIRVAAGVVTLWVLVRRRGPVAVGRPGLGSLALGIYMLGFSWAYLSLGAGLGALILFGVVQLVMFGWAVWAGQSVPVLRWTGAGIAFGGLVLLLWPTGAAPVPLLGAASMAAAGAAWGGYTILGQGQRDALLATTKSFIWCLPLMILPAFWAAGWGSLSVNGILIAALAGSVTSGLGYALWYRVLPNLPTTVAASAQLSVPVIAVAAGAVFLDESVTLRIVLAGGLTLGGIAVSLIRRG